MEDTKMQQAVLRVVAEAQSGMLDVFTDQRLVLGLVLACSLLSLLRIRVLFVPFMKLAIVYSVVFVAILAALYGPDDVANLNSLKHVRRSAKAAVAASAVCFFLGYFTPKKARRST